MINVQGHIVVKLLEFIDGIMTLTELREIFFNTDKILTNLLVEVYAQFILLYVKLNNIVIKLVPTIGMNIIPMVQWVNNLSLFTLRFRKMIAFHLSRLIELTRLYSLLIMDLIKLPYQVFFRGKLFYAIRLRNLFSPLHYTRKNNI